MGLGIISNPAANAALRNLQINSDNATSSVAKLSSGMRVTNAADDAASLAIGSRLNTEVQSLAMATQNASQATSMMQIVDGTLSRVQDIMTRMKALSVQAGSQNLSDTERAMLNTEYQNHLEEIDRMVMDTKFSGKQLLVKDYQEGDLFYNGVAVNNTVAANTNAEQTTDFINVSLRGWDNRGVTLGGNGDLTLNISVAGAANYTFVDADADGAADADIAINLEATSGDGTMTKQVILDKTLFYNDDPSTPGNWRLKTGVTISFRDGEVTADVGYDQYSQDNLDLVVSLAEDAVFADNGGALNFGGSGDFTASLASQADEDLAGGMTFLDFKVGTGILSDEDVISLTLSSVNAELLGLTNSAIDTAGGADAASTAVSQALDHLVNVRADIGGSMNRLDQASANIATSMENLEAARSGMMDLDVAAEITYFTSQQILVQSGISSLAQANQLPQNLLRLLS